MHSIQVRDNGGRIHSLWKKDLASLTVEKKTLMPSYAGQLSETEITDLVAYLASLRGMQ